MGWSHYLFLPWILGLTIQVCISPIQCNVEEIMNNGQGCHPDEFECLSGTCFPKNHHCDGHIDCYDMSDEHNCDFVLCKEPEWFKCNNGRCVKKSFTCDFDNDCEDLSDEKNCPGHEEMNNNINCSSLDFQCTSDKVCLPLNWACDGHPDCADGSDEVLGCAGKAVCNGKFMCNSTHNCIPAEFHCDGEIDCEDGSDEFDCPKVVGSHEGHSCTIENHKFLCKDLSSCIDLHQLCDHTPHCFDKSDEGGHCYDINLCVNSTCSFDCLHTPTGPQCYCPLDSKLIGNKCVDINECLEYGICDQQCINFNNSGYRCACEPGYMLKKDRRTCQVEEGEGLLIFSTLNEIRAYQLTSETYYPIVSHLSNAIGVSYDGHYVYWTNVHEGQESIVKSLKDGSEKTTILDSGVFSPEDLAVDLVTKNIYFTDLIMQHIAVCTNDGSACVVLHSNDVDKPRAIALQPNEGMMYWSDWGKKPMIARSGMDGSEVSVLVSDNIQFPNGIAIDHGNGRLYWIDAKPPIIQSIMLDGSSRKVITGEAMAHPFSIAVFEDSLYWSDLEGTEIQACNKFTGKNLRSIIRETKNSIFRIHVYHESMKSRINISNPCEDSGCSDMCLLAPPSRPLRYACACPEDKILSPNGHTCNKGKRVQTIIAGFEKTLIMLEHKSLGKQFTSEIKIPDINKIGALAFDSLTGNIIISDSGDETLSSLDIATGHRTLLLSGNLGKVEGMDIDPLGHNLYWVDSKRLTVEVLSLKSLERTILVNDFGGESPLDIVLAPHQGFMFVALASPRGSHIDRFYMNGLGRMHLIEDRIIGPSIALAYDSNINQLFFADRGSGLIERVDVDGLERQVFQEVYGTPTSIAILENEVFWVSHGIPALEYANKFRESERHKQLILNIDIGWNSMKIIAVTERVAAENHVCQNNNGGCSHLCLVSPHSSSCGCPIGMSLKLDKTTCEKPNQCSGSQFRCKTGECISDMQRCNYKNDCPEGDDELDCSYHNIQCQRGQYQCQNGEKCLEEHTKCDGHSDCSDRSDEMNCHTHESCFSDDFQCNSGDCIPMQLRCDGKHDCQDSSDELDCEHLTCHSKDFRCNDGTCRPASWECDGEYDCSDGSDEHSNCVVKKTCSLNEFSCNNGRCLEHDLICDGNDDCEDNSDEFSCVNERDYVDYSELDETIREPSHTDESKEIIIHKCNEETEFKCDSQPGVCLPKAVRCNGTSECLRGEDETNCNGCYSNEFECVHNKRCILKEWVCDTLNDCGDNSDEDPMMCKFHNRSSPRSLGAVVYCTNFECKNRQQCLSYNQVCDKHPDCDDGSDEGGQCEQSCLNSGCQDTCRKTPYGPHCECSHGYTLMGDARTCSDIDECKLGTYCNQYCQNTDGGFLCSCRHSDYMLREDRMSCKAKGPKMKYVYALGNQIRYITQSFSLVGVIYNNRGTELRVSGLDVNAKKNLVYWTSDLGGTLTKISLDNRGKTEVIKNLVRPTRMSVDWITENVYFVENYNQIKVCHFGIQKCALIFTAKPGVKIDALVVDPLSKLMFWSEEAGIGYHLLIDHHNPSSAIKRADLQGHNSVSIVDMEIQKISDIVVDPIHNVIYFLDAHHGKIDRCNFNGTNRQTVFQSPDIPVELGLFENSIYWLVKGANPKRQRELETYGNVWHCGLTGPKVWMCDVIKIVPKNMLGHPFQFKIMHEALQPGERDPCKLLNCTHVCVLTESGGSCLCENGAHVHPGEICKATNISKTIFTTEAVKTEKSKTSLSWGMLSAILFLFVILPAVTGVLYFTYHDIIRWCCQPRQNKFIFSSFHFRNNPTYNDGISHTESAFHHGRLDPGQHHYENPMLGKLNESNVEIISSNEMNSFSNLKKVDFHLTDFADDESSSVEYSDTLTDSHRLPLIQ